MQKLFVLSMDAMVHEDIAYLENKPNFKKIMQKRAEVEKVCSVYPASTYPAHTTLMTGCYPGKHGVNNNFHLRTVADGIAHWPLRAKNVFVEDLFAAAKRAGATTAAVFWPITGCNRNIDHVINEYFFYYGEERNKVEEVFAQQGSDAAALQAVRENMHYFPTSEDPKASLADRFDDFLMGCTCSLIRNVQPDVLLVHNSYPDTIRHSNGVFSEAATKALDRTDEWLGWVIEAMESAGVYEQTNFVILSDHGQMDYNRSVRINVLLQQGGFLDMAPNGTIYNWQAYAQTNGKSAAIHLIDPTNRKLYDRVYEYLCKLQKEEKYAIERIFEKDELQQRYGLCGPFSFMIEAAENFSFSNLLEGEPLVQFLPDERHACHGYMPEKGPQPVFLAHGPAFKDGAVLESAKLVDIAPTLAAVFGQTLPDADGCCLRELLK